LKGEKIMSKETTGTALMKLDNYAILQMNTADLKEVLQENLGGQQLSAFELDRVKIPSGGGTMWEVPTLEGTEDAKAIEGVVIYFKDQNGYWKEDYDGQNNPPDCMSNDTLVGIGNPGGECARCPLNQYGSDDKGKGKACKNMRTLFILREGDVLPLVLTLPPTSLKEARKYFLRLASKAVPYYGVVTEITLEKDKNEGGITYSKAKLTLKSRLDAGTVKKLKEFQESLRPALEAVKVDQEARFPEEEKSE
jgi:hypothetical protein